MAHLCPWWLTYTFDNPLRRLLHNPETLLGPYLRPGMRVADVGCGMGYFTGGLAQLVGETGHVQAVDIQARQLQAVRRRLEAAGTLERVTLVQARPEKLGLEGPLDLVLCFWMVHEVPDIRRFLGEIRDALAPDGCLLVAEPKMHVSSRAFERELEVAREVGLVGPRVDSRVRFSRASLLQKR